MHALAASDVVNAGKVPPADAWVRRTFGAEEAVTQTVVESALSQVKDQFTRGSDGTYVLKGWPRARRMECQIGGAAFERDERLKGDGGAGDGGSPGVAAGKRHSPRTSDACRRSETPVRSGPSGDATDARGEQTGERAGDTAEARGVAPLTAGTKRDAPERVLSALASPQPKKKHKMAPAPGQAPKPASPPKPTSPPKPKSQSPKSKPMKTPPPKPRLPPKKAKPPSPTPSPTPSPEPDVNPGDVNSKVKFVGAPRRGSVYRNRTYYNGFEVITNKRGVVRKHTYKVSDCVFALPGSEEEDMYIAQIDGIFEDEDGQWVECIWLERSKDVEAFVGKRAWKEYKDKLLPGEVFLCTTVNTNPIQSIEGPAKVLTEEQFKAGPKAGKKLEGKEEVFVCRKAMILSLTSRKKPTGSFAPVEFEKGRGFCVLQPPPKHAGKSRK